MNFLRVIKIQAIDGHHKQKQYEFRISNVLMENKRDRSASPKRKTGDTSPHWLKPGLSTQTIVYFRLALECDTPILEALFYAVSGCYAEWTGVDFAGMAQYFFEKFRDCFKATVQLSPLWDECIFSTTDFPNIIQWTKDQHIIELNGVGRLCKNRHGEHGCHTVVKFSIYDHNHEKPLDYTSVALLHPDHDFGFSPKFVSDYHGGRMYEWIIPTRTKLDGQVLNSVNNFCVKHKEFFEQQ